MYMHNLHILRIILKRDNFRDFLFASLDYEVLPKWGLFLKERISPAGACISCNEPFTVKHFLIACTEFNHIRKIYFTAKTVKELFSDTPSAKINFLKEINLFNKL